MGQVPIRVLDCGLCDFFDELFFDGEHISIPGQVMSAIKWFNPELVTQSLKTTFPRAHGALDGWRRVAPGQTRIGMPEEALYALIGTAMWEGEFIFAILIAIQFDTYARPSEISDMLGNQVLGLLGRASHNLASVGIILRPWELLTPSKTGLYVEAILLSSWMLFLVPALAALVSSIPLTARLWPYSISQVTKITQRLGAMLGLARLDLTAYSTRHGSAATDRLKGRRTRGEIKDRGRWLADSSVRRYEKSALLVQQRDFMPPRTLSYGYQVMAQRKTVFALLAEEINNAAMLAALDAVFSHRLSSNHVETLNEMLKTSQVMQRAMIDLKLRPPYVV